MPKLYYKFGTMGSSKTANALMTKFNYEQTGHTVMLMKSSIDNRAGDTVIQFRIGLSSDATVITQNDSIYELWCNLGIYNTPDVIIIDECQFLTKQQIEDLKYIAARHIPILCYGLKTNFKSELFEGSKRLLEIADSISEIKSVCACGRKSIVNAKYEGESVIFEGEEIDIGGDEKYVAMCYECWIEGKIEGMEGDGDNMEANTVKLKQYFHYNGLHMLHLIGKVWLQYDNNIPKSDDNKGLFRCGNKYGYKWNEGWFRFVIGKYGIGLFFIDKVLMNNTWNGVIKRWEDRDNGR